MRIAVTGGTGSVGPPIVQAARMAGHELVVVARRPRELLPGGILLVPGDVTRPETLDAAFAGADVVFHAAAAVGRSTTDRVQEQTTLGGTRNVVAAALRAGVRRLVYLGSIAVHEPAAVIHETSPFCSATRHSYARAKRAAEDLVNQAATVHGLEVVTLRPGLVLGPGERHVTPRLIGLLRRGLGFLVGDGSNRVPCVTQTDLAGAALAAMERPQAKGPYVLASAEIVTQADLWRWHARAAGFEEPRRVLSRRLVEALAILAEAAAGGIGAVPWITPFEVFAMTADVRVDTTRAMEHLSWRGAGPIEGAVASAVEALRNAPASSSGFRPTLLTSAETRCK